jgi:hypothetical protein
MAAAWMDAMPWIDFAVNGEADLAFPALLWSLCRGGNPLAVPGVIGRRAGAVVAGPPPVPVQKLELPVPDYGENSIARRS